MNKLAHLTFLRVAGLAAGAAAVSGAVVLVSASAAGYNLPFLTTSSSPSRPTTASLGQAGQPSALCTDFLTHLSAELNASPAALNAAYQKAIGKTLADEVKSRKLTQARANAIQKRLAGKAPCAIAAGVQPPRPGLAAFRPALLSAAASALGISDQTLKADLKKGMSFSQIAVAQNVTEVQFRDRLIAKLKPVLDAAVTNKQLTPAPEQAIIKRLQTGTIPLWNRPVRNPAATPTTAVPSA
jgi:hypothetical protein